MLNASTSLVNLPKVNMLISLTSKCIYWRITATPGIMQL